MELSKILQVLRSSPTGSTGKKRLFQSLPISWPTPWRLSKTALEALLEREALAQPVWVRCCAAPCADGRAF